MSDSDDDNVVSASCRREFVNDVSPLGANKKLKSVHTRNPASNGSTDSRSEDNLQRHTDGQKSSGEGFETDGQLNEGDPHPSLDPAILQHYQQQQLSDIAYFTEHCPNWNELSKNAQKRMIKERRWKETRKLRREEEKARKKTRRAEQRVAATAIPSASTPATTSTTTSVTTTQPLDQTKPPENPSSSVLAPAETGLLTHHQAKRRSYHIKKGDEQHPWSKQLSILPYRLVIDLDFEDKQQAREIKSLCQQVMYCYSANRRLETPVHLICTGVKQHGPIAERLSMLNSQHWQTDICTLESRQYHELYSKDELVYLTSESSTELIDVDPDKVYVIGGIVDHNRYKGLTHELAEERGIATARMPMDQFLAMKTRKVLAVNHIFDIMVHCIIHHNWKGLMEHIPARYGATALAEEHVQQPQERSQHTEQPGDGEDSNEQHHASSTDGPY